MSLSFRERNPVILGVVGTIIIAGLLLLAANASAITRYFTTASYSAAFSEAGGLGVGDDVRVAGTPAGKVTAISLSGAVVKVEFDLDRDVRFGDATTARIKTATPLGKKYLEIEPAGDAVLPAGSQIPAKRTQAPYDLTQALSDLTNTTGRVDTQRLAQALDTISQTFADTPDDLAAALQGIKRISQTISSRDSALQDLLSHASDVTATLAQRRGQIQLLIEDGNTLLTELTQRKKAISRLLVNVTRVSEQLSGLAKDNRRQLKPALEDLRGVLYVLNKNRASLAEAIERLGPFMRSLGEAVGSGPFFLAYLHNLAPTNLAPLLPQLIQQGGGK